MSKDTNWRVSNIKLTWYRGRDHQVINPHRNGWIDVHIWTGMQNTQRKLRYYFADGAILEHDPEEASKTPEEMKVAWFDFVIEGGHEVELCEEIVDLWKEVAEEELKWLGFEIQEESPDWHFVNNNE